MVVLRGGTHIDKDEEERSARALVRIAEWEKQDRMAAEIVAPCK